MGRRAGAIHPARQDDLVFVEELPAAFGQLHPHRLAQPAIENPAPRQFADEFALGVADLVARPEREHSPKGADERRLFLLADLDDAPGPEAAAPPPGGADDGPRGGEKEACAIVATAEDEGGLFEQSGRGKAVQGSGAKIFHVSPGNPI